MPQSDVENGPATARVRTFVSFPDLVILQPSDWRWWAVCEWHWLHTLSTEQVDKRNKTDMLLLLLLLMLLSK